jgi:hypothetical protein
MQKKPGHTASRPSRFLFVYSAAGVIRRSCDAITTGPSPTHGPAINPIRIDRRVSARDGIFKISDVIIDGLSMAANGRSQLEGVVERNGGRPQVILPVMRQQIASLYTLNANSWLARWCNPARASHA